MTYQPPPNIDSQPPQPAQRQPGLLPPQAYEYAAAPQAARPGGLPPGFEPRSASKPPQRRPIGTLIVGILVGAVVTAGIIFGVQNTSLGGASSIEVAGSLELSGSGAFIALSNDSSDQSCTGTGGYSDISQGVQVTITDSAGKTLVAVPLGAGALGHGDCTFAFKASVPADKASYGVTISHRGTIDFTSEQIATAQLTLGD